MIILIRTSYHSLQDRAHHTIQRVLDWKRGNPLPQQGDKRRDNGTNEEEHIDVPDWDSHIDTPGMKAWIERVAREVAEAVKVSIMLFT